MLFSHVCCLFHFCSIQNEIGRYEIGRLSISISVAPTVAGGILSVGRSGGLSSRKGVVG